MNELIGFVCSCEFRMEGTRWPVEGFPAWVVVDAVDMPMVKMRSKFAGNPFWINAQDISLIRSTGGKSIS